ncbi:MAG TPA: PEP-CTERM sorting domain-containing protein [Opitutaceae bacterium]
MLAAARSLLLLLVFALPAAAQVVLNFDDLTLGDYDDIPATYGDRLDPNLLDIGYATRSASTGELIAANLDFWNRNYGDLTNIAFATENGAVAEITFVPAEGYGVRLVSFDLAGWPNLDRTSSILRLVDANQKVVFDFAANGPVMIEGNLLGPQHSTFAPNFTFDGTLRLQWGTDWNIGVDNIVFEAVPLSVIPEPSTWALLVVGVALVWLSWRRRRGA